VPERGGGGAHRLWPARDAVTPAREAAEIAARTQDPWLTRQANLNLGLAQLVLGGVQDAFATAEVSARIDRGPRDIGACGLLDITAFRLGARKDARAAFQTAVIRRGTPWASRISGWRSIDYEQRSQFLKDAAMAFVRARRITTAAGAVKRIPLNSFLTEPELTESMSKVADGDPSPFD
jgi:hypothetical protein